MPTELTEATKLQSVHVYLNEAGTLQTFDTVWKGYNGSEPVFVRSFYDTAVGADFTGNYSDIHDTMLADLDTIGYSNPV